MTYLQTLLAYFFRHWTSRICFEQYPLRLVNAFDYYSLIFWERLDLWRTDCIGVVDLLMPLKFHFTDFGNHILCAIKFCVRYSIRRLLLTINPEYRSWAQLDDIRSLIRMTR